MVRDTGGGLLFPPGSVGGLAAALGRMLREGSLAEECGRRAHQAVHHRYGAERMARQTLELYEILHRAPLSRRERDPRGAPE